MNCEKSYKKMNFSDLSGRNQETVVLRTKKEMCCLTNRKFEIDGTEYIEGLFNDEKGEIPEMENLNGLIILKEEVKKAIDTLRPGKAPGEDEIATEMLQASDEIGIDKVTELCNKIYDTGYIPDDMRKSTFIPIPKKVKVVNCTDFQTISLMSHITKNLLKNHLASQQYSNQPRNWRKPKWIQKRKRYARRNILICTP